MGNIFRIFKNIFLYPLLYVLFICTISIVSIYRFGPSLSAQIVAISTILLFVGISITGYSDVETYPSYLFAEFDVDQIGFESSLAASNIPLVLGLLFFLTLGESFGGFTILALAFISVIPFATLAFFRKPAGSFAKKNITLHEFLEFSFRRSERIGSRDTYKDVSNKKLRRVAAIISILSFFLSVGFELLFGARFITPLLGIQFDLLGLPVPFVVAIFLSICVGLYTSLGGFRAVFRTDVAQYFIIAVGVLILGYVVFFTKGGAGNINWSFEANKTLTTCILFGSFVFYPLWYLSTMDTWQRAAATSQSQSQESWQLWGGVFVVIVYLCAGLLGSTEVISGDGGIVSYLLDQIDGGLNISSFSAVILYGSLTAALLSTLDTYSHMIVQAIYNDVFLKDWRFATKYISTSSVDKMHAVIEHRAKEVAQMRGVVAAVPVASVFIAKGIALLEIVDPRSLFYVAFAGQCALAIPVIVALCVEASEMKDEGLPGFFEARLLRRLACAVSKLEKYRVVCGSRIAVAIASGYLFAIGIAGIVSGDSLWLYITPVISVSISFSLIHYYFKNSIS